MANTVTIQWMILLHQILLAEHSAICMIPEYIKDVQPQCCKNNTMDNNTYNTMDTVTIQYNGQYNVLILIQ